MPVNPYLVYPFEEIGDLPTRVYALAEALEADGKGSWFVGLDAIDAAFFDQEMASGIVERWGDKDARLDFFVRARLFGIELVHYNPGKAFFNDEPDWSGRSEYEWLELTITSAGSGLPAQLYRNIFGEGQAIGLAGIRAAPPPIQAALNATDPLAPIPDASDQTVERVLQPVPASDFVAVYDVGQGNMNALCDSTGRPHLYFDMGGGIQGNRKTFPTAFGSACFGATPPIVLSHWDKDHWAYANVFTQALHMTWIVPRQKPLGKSHGMLVQSIVASGTLLVWSPSGGTLPTSHLDLVVANGSGRNHSGLNLIAHSTQNASADDILMPGDAAYAYIPGMLPKTLLSIVASHHGGALHVSGVPPSAGAAHSRLAYSVGSNNTYRHPTSSARQDHHNAGWSDHTISTSKGADLVRDTRNRTSAGYGHISLHWRLANRLPSTCGSCTTTCDLKIQQN